MQCLARIRILEPENTNTLGPSELRIRRVLSIGYRFAVAIFVTTHLFDFLFSSIWMHGYIWSLNLPIDLDMSDKSAGAIVYHQLEQVGNLERLCLMTAKVLAITLLLMFSGFASGTPQTVWKLFRLSACIGVLTAFLRPMQLKQRLFSSLHEGFYCFFITFVVGVTLAVRALDSLPRPTTLQQRSVAETVVVLGINKKKSDHSMFFGYALLGPGLAVYNPKKPMMEENNNNETTANSAVD